VGARPARSTLPAADAPQGKTLNVLALNSGSSSLKFGLYRVGLSQTETMLSGEAQAIGAHESRFCAADSRRNELLTEAAPIPSHGAAVIRIGGLLADLGLPAPSAIGHRVVHGGPTLLRHCLLDDSVLRQLEAASAFAPLHTPAALVVIHYAQAHFPGLPQVACFDTAFHAELPEVARTLPIARDLPATGLQRYGFHGLSCESIVHQSGAALPARTVIAHLGNGASVTAVRNGKSIDTSMGLTPTGGVMMGTRSGDLDPGVLLYLLREKQFDAAMLEDLVDHRSGLLGISGTSSDMRLLHAAAPTDAAARLAIQMFCYGVRKQVAGMVAALDGVDLLVFTGGIGENDAEVRAGICVGLSCVGVRLDAARNRTASNPISTAAASCAVRVLASQEDEQIARHTATLLASGSA
jgi:acetate kinase